VRRELDRANQTLEERVAALERAVSELKAQQAANPRWWEQIARVRTPEQLQTFDDAMEYGRYFRSTGKDPPPDWKPGDPIPEPDYDA
jgi:hypothetical protein